MKLKLYYLLFTLLFLITFSACTPVKNGNNLKGFSERMNEYNESYNMATDGYIFDSEARSYTRFFDFGNEYKIMLQFICDEKNRTKQMNLVFTKKTVTESEAAYCFLIDCIKAFCCNDTTANELIAELDLNTFIASKSIKTKSAEVDKISLKADTTNIGTVISLYNDHS